MAFSTQSAVTTRIGTHCRTAALPANSLCLNTFQYTCQTTTTTPITTGNELSVHPVVRSKLIAHVHRPHRTEPSHETVNAFHSSSHCPDRNRRFAQKKLRQIHFLTLCRQTVFFLAFETALAVRSLSILWSQLLTIAHVSDAQPEMVSALLAS